VLSLRGQSPAATQPPWQDAAQKANDARVKGHWAEADQLIQSAWANTQQSGAAEEYFPAGAQTVVNFYVSAGRGLKAEAVLHAAEAAVAQLPGQNPNRLAILSLKAQTYQNQGRAIEAEAIYEQLLPLEVKAFGQGSFEARSSLQALAHSYDGSGELEKAEALFRRLDSMSPDPLRNARPMLPGTPDKLLIMYTGRAAVVSRSWYSRSVILWPGACVLADFYDRHGRFADAEKAYQASVARAEREDAQNHGLDGALYAYQNFLQRHRRYAEAEQMQMRIIELHQNSSNPADADRNLGDRQNLAMLYMEADQFDQANKLYEQMRADLEASKGTGSEEYRGLQQNYAFALMRQQKFDAAEKLATELAQHASSEPNDYTRENALNLLAEIRDRSGDRQSAEAYRAQAAAMGKGRASAADPTGIAADIESARTLLAQGEVAQAWSRIGQALAAAESAEPFRTFDFLNQIANLGSSFPEKNADMADELIERVRAIQERVVSPTDPLYNPWLVANYYQGHGRWQEAERMWNSYMLALENANGANHPRLTVPLIEMGNLYRRQNRLQDAVATARRVLNIQEKASGPNSEPVLHTLERLGQWYFDLQDQAAAMESYERQVRLSARISGQQLSHGHVLTNAAQAYAGHQQFDRAIEWATEALNIGSQPEYAAQTQFFRGVLESIEKQKAAASQPQPPSADRGPGLNVERFGPAGGTRLFQPKKAPPPKP